MLDAFAGLLVELHLSSCYWGDCNLSNVLYRFDAEAIDTIMVDAETAETYLGPLSDGRREEDLEIMIENVAGGMADIAAAAGADIDDADLELGLDIAERYRNLWAELSRTEAIAADERYRITERLERINRLGFDVEEVDLVPTADDTERLVIKVRVGGRTYHSSRLKALTGVDALENQARAILSDVHYYTARHEDGTADGQGDGRDPLARRGVRADPRGARRARRPRRPDPGVLRRAPPPVHARVGGEARRRHARDDRRLAREGPPGVSARLAERRPGGVR